MNTHPNINRWVSKRGLRPDTSPVGTPNSAFWLDRCRSKNDRLRAVMTPQQFNALYDLIPDDASFMGVDAALDRFIRILDRNEGNVAAALQVFAEGGKV